jgi:ABC-type Zn2+ transport system substrate-binding protein/surface adhesin
VGCDQVLDKDVMANILKFLDMSLQLVGVTAITCLAVPPMIAAMVRDEDEDEDEDEDDDDDDDEDEDEDEDEDDDDDDDDDDD